MVGKSVPSNEMLLVSAAHQRGAEAAKFHGSLASLAGTALSPFCPQIVSTQSSLSSCFRIQLFMAMVCVCVCLANQMQVISVPSLKRLFLNSREK